MTAISEGSLVLVGAGRAGRAFARSWIAAGGRVNRVLVRHPPPAADDFAGASVEAVGATEPSACDILVLAVPDDAIAAVAGELAQRLACRFAFHLSGALGGEALSPLARAGASVASLHPLRPFTGEGDEDWTDAFVAVEGDRSGVAMGEAIARALGARPHRISAGSKPLYHAAASLAAGGAAAVVSVAVRAWVEAGIPEDIAREALAGLAARATAAVGTHPFAEAFTGAVARRDVGTVGAHARVLAGHEPALDLYRVLAEEILQRTPGLGKEEEVRSLLRVRKGSERARGSASS